MAERLPLTDLPNALKSQGIKPPKYRACYAAAVDAVIPAKKGENNRWTVAASDLPAIAAAMGLSDAHAA